MKVEECDRLVHSNPHFLFQIINMNKLLAYVHVQRHIGIEAIRVETLSYNNIQRSESQIIIFHFAWFSYIWCLSDIYHTNNN